MSDFAMTLTCTDTKTRREVEKTFISNYLEEVRKEIDGTKTEKFTSEKVGLWAYK